MRCACRLLTWLIVALLAVPPTGCALINRDKRLLTRLTTQQVIPEDPVVKWSTLPLWGTLGVVTLTADALLVNPVLAAPAALDDALWAFTGTGLFGPAEVVLMPVRTVGFVGLFLGSEILRCTLPNPFE